MASVAEWVEGLRPRTLPASLSPIPLGAGAAAAVGQISWGRLALAAVVALALQIGVNFANDYSDGVRGTDAERRGPRRLVASGAASPRAVRTAAFASFGVAGLAGAALVALCGQWWLLVVGAAAVAAAWFYTGGSRPYGYMGLGEVGVFVFFGPVAVLGTTYTQVGAVPWTAVAGSVGVGLLACAILMLNNLRDIEGDAEAGKRTLAVRLGARRSRLAYALELGVAMVCAAVCAVATPWALITLVLLPWAVLLARGVLGGETGPALIGRLAATGRLELAYGVLLGAALALSRLV